MANEVKLPRLGQGMEAGTIVKWLKSEGEEVEKGEPLYELDTDKVTQEVEADFSGVLLKIAVPEGEVPVGRTIAVIGKEGEEVPDAVEVVEDEEEEGVSVEVLDPRTLLPLDEEALVESVKKTNRCVVAHEAVTRMGFGAEVAAIVQEKAFDYLDAPVERVGAKFAPIPFAPVMEDYVVPHADDVLEAVRRTVGRG